MPKRMEEALKRSAKKHGYTEGSEEYGRYVYGTMAKKEKEQHDATDKAGDTEQRHDD